MSTPSRIFLSYNREDHAVARRFAEAFEAAAFDVWWDATLHAGEAYDEVTENALNQAHAVVVLWSPRSVVSRWVRAEATQADRNKTLVPVMIEPCKRPIMFELTQTADLSHWTGSPADRAWVEFVADVKRFVEGGASTARPDPARDAPSLAQAAAASRPDRLSICVLPFANMSGDSDQEYFADGITEDIITDLSKVSALSVIARNSAFIFKGKHVDVLQVARQLNVSHVLEGSVRKSGNRARITAQLVDGVTNNHVWAERYDRALNDIFALQDEISQAIVKALKLKLLREERGSIAERGTVNIEAYDFFLRARALESTLSGPEIRRSLDLYRKAVALDPDFAQAWAGLSAAIFMATITYPDLSATALTEMEQAIARASELAPDLPEVHSGQLRQCQLRRDWARAEDHLASLKLLARPQIGIPGTDGMVLCILGRANEAVEYTLMNRQADPLSSGLSFVLQYFLGCAGRLEEAEAEYERSRDLPGTRGFIEWRAITRAMVLKDGALVRQRLAAAFYEDVTFMPFAPKLLKVLDQPDEALAIVRAALEHPACQDGVRMGAIAHWAAYYGDDDLALKALRLGTVELYTATVADIWSPAYARLRRDPRFKTILRDIGLYDHWRSTGNWGDFARPVGEDDFEIFA